MEFKNNWEITVNAKHILKSFDIVNNIICTGNQLWL